MAFWISREDGPELGQQPLNGGSKYDAYIRSYDGTRTTHEGNTKMWIFIVVYTRRTHEGYTTSYWEYDAFELDHEGVTWTYGKGISTC
jgi:hypothetical protein